VVLAGLLSALRITGRRMRDQRVVFAGAGASAQGISELLVTAFMEDGLSREEAVRRIWTTDSRGLVARGRTGLEAFKATYARPAEELADYACLGQGYVDPEILDHLEQTVERAMWFPEYLPIRYER
jgi:malate dehydrogenase (oxaloacetate-decarboxylating)(NADP+)